jgi:hypothetical protein
MTSSVDCVVCEVVSCCSIKHTNQGGEIDSRVLVISRYIFSLGFAFTFETFKQQQAHIKRLSNLPFLYFRSHVKTFISFSADFKLMRTIRFLNRGHGRPVIFEGLDAELVFFCSLLANWQIAAVFNINDFCTAFS